MELLTEHFEAALDAPDGIEKLRGLIVTLAMQGKLTSRSENPSSTATLLRKIEIEKNDLLSKKLIKKAKKLKPITKKEIPFQLPNNWEWVRLGTIASYNERPKQIPTSVPETTWLLDLKDIEKKTSKLIYRATCSERQAKSSKTFFEPNDVLYGKLRPYLDKVIVADKAGICTTEIVPISPYHGVLPHYLKWSLKRPDFLRHVSQLMYGMKMPRLGTADAINSLHPLPPFEEQKRIVTKIDELMARCDELELLRKQRNQKRIHVNAVAIKELLSSKNSSSFNHAWTFIRNNFNELYSTKENIAELRRAILQLAVMGKLVPQDESEEPASVLLKRIEVQKQQLIKEKKIKKQKRLATVSEEEKLFSIPSTWKWSRLGQFAEIISGFAYKSPTFQTTGNNQVLRLGNVKQDKILLSAKPVYIADCLSQSTQAFCLSPNDIVISMTGTRAKRDYLYTARVTENPYNGKTMYINQRVGAIRAFFDSQYLAIALKVESLKTPIFATATGSANQANIGIRALNNWILPIPPLDEQKRIVTKAKELISLCDKLQSDMDTRSRYLDRLLDSILTQL